MTHTPFVEDSIQKSPQLRQMVGDEMNFIVCKSIQLARPFSFTDVLIYINCSTCMHGHSMNFTCICEFSFNSCMEQFNAHQNRNKWYRAIKIGLTKQKSKKKNWDRTFKTERKKYTTFYYSNPWSKINFRKHVEEILLKSLFSGL